MFRPLLSYLSRYKHLQTGIIGASGGSGEVGHARTHTTPCPFAVSVCCEWWCVSLHQTRYPTGPTRWTRHQTCTPQKRGEIWAEMTIRTIVCIIDQLCQEKPDYIFRTLYLPRHTCGFTPGVSTSILQALSSTSILKPYPRVQ